MFGDHTYCDSSWCWARDCNEFVHKAIMDKINEKTFNANNNEHLLTDLNDGVNDGQGDGVDDDVEVNINNNEDNEETVDIETEWAEALIVRFDAIDETNELMESDDGSGDEWMPEGLHSDDDSRINEEGKLTCTIDDLLMEEMQYEVAICDNLDNYGIEQTVFNEGELSEIRRKERILVKRRDKGCYRCKSIHKTAYIKIIDTLRKYIKRSIKQKCKCVCTKT